MERNRRKMLTGVVVSRSGDKSIKVSYSYKIPHPMYKKEIRRKTVVHAHDQENACHVGDTVEIMSCRPLSRLKHWRVVRVLQVAQGLQNSAA